MPLFIFSNKKKKKKSAAIQSENVSLLIGSFFCHTRALFFHSKTLPRASRFSGERRVGEEVRVSHEPQNCARTALSQHALLSPHPCYGSSDAGM